MQSSSSTATACLFGNLSTNLAIWLQLLAKQNKTKNKQTNKQTKTKSTNKERNKETKNKQTKNKTKSIKLTLYRTSETDFFLASSFGLLITSAVSPSGTLESSPCSVVPLATIHKETHSEVIVCDWLHQIQEVNTDESTVYLIQSDTMATVFLLHVLVQLQFEGSVFLESPQP